jgi:hypothetical protein
MKKCILVQDVSWVEEFFMYQRSASSAIESMNWANKSARARTAVDVVSSTKLLLKLFASRYQVKKEEAWKWEEALTPYGTKLRDAAFETINFYITGSTLIMKMTDMNAG